MTRNDLISALIRSNLYRGTWQLDDADYSTVSTEFVRMAHAEWLASSLPLALIVLRDIGGGKTVRAVRWEPESGDCDNIARDFGCYLSRCMWVDAVTNRTKRGNVAAGSFNFMPTVTTGHAVNWFCDHAGVCHVFDAGAERMDHLTDLQLFTISSGAST